MKKPYFVEAEILRDGSVKLTDDDGEIFNVQMRNDQAWPMLSRQLRRYELMESYEKFKKQAASPQPNPAPPGPPKLKAV